MEPIKVCIADDYKLFRKLTKSYLQTIPYIDFHIEEAGNGKEVLKIMRTNPVDVVLLDISMPIMTGEEAAAIIVRRYPNTKIIILTIHDTVAKVVELMNIGVHGYLLKDCEPGEVAHAIKEVVEKDFYQNKITTRALQFLNPKSEKRGRDRLLEELTNREREILLHICEEFTMKEISAKLSISEKTVENHRMNMLHKLSVKNTVGLVKYAYQNSLIPLN